MDIQKLLKIGEPEIVELQQQSLNLSFDAYPLKEDLSSLDQEKMDRFFEKVNATGRAHLRDDPLANLTIEDLKRDDYVPAHRNRLLAEAFYLTGDIEKYGTGLIRVRELIKIYPIPS